MAECRVFFHDQRGIEHAVRVEAENRFVAFGLALHRFKQGGCCNPDYRGVEKLNVHVMEGDRVKYRLRVTRDQFEQWIGPPEPTLDPRRNYLLMLLGRIEPDRNFKRGLTR